MTAPAVYRKRRWNAAPRGWRWLVLGLRQSNFQFADLVELNRLQPRIRNRQRIALRPRPRFENGVSCVRLALPRREIPGVHFRPCRAPSGSSPGRYGCADRTSGSNGSVVAPKATHPATQSSCPHLSSTASRRKPLQSVFVMESAQYRCRHDLMTERKAVSARFDSQVARPRIGNAWS
jgi:hypothetical protein